MGSKRRSNFINGIGFSFCIIKAASSRFAVVLFLLLFPPDVDDDDVDVNIINAASDASLEI